jgi:hypothetical protein
MSFAGGCLLLAWVVASILVNGIAPVHYLTKLRGLELVGYGAAAGILLHGLLGLGIAGLPAGRAIFVVILTGLSLVDVVYFLVRGIGRELSAALSRSAKLALALWLGFLVLCVGILHLEVRFPDALPDGPYVFKTHSTNVKIQYLTSLPADNYIPFAVSEFFLRSIPFKTERPIMPANEVSNRTVLMSLVALPFRSALGAPRSQPGLGTSSYVGRDWPDVGKLNTDGYYEQFAIVGLVLNSMLLLGAIVFCAGLGAGSIVPLAALLYVANPYFIGQTIYTWPKALAGFFVLLAWHSVRSGHRPVVVGALMALACHAHPYAVAFAGWVALFYLLQWRRQQSALPSLLIYLATFVALLLPWIVWTQCVLQIPSDLMAQNFSGPGTEIAWTSPMNFIRIRVQNLFFTICSTIFVLHPSNLGDFLDGWLVSLPGVVGLVLFFPALAQFARLPKPQAWLWFAVVGPTLSILAIYSCPALLVLHGFQAPLALLLFFGVWWLSEHCSRRVYLGLVAVQLLVNLAMLAARGLTSGVHF